jgi:uncharacterized protein
MMLIKTRVQPSPIHGLGLFAASDVPRGTPIWRFDPVLDRELTPEQIAALPLVARDHIHFYGFVNRDTGQTVLAGDHACFMNHSPMPNTGAPPGTGGAVNTQALRDIRAGEEITCNYHEFDADVSWKLGGLASEKS